VQLEILRRVKQEKQTEISTQAMFRHFGYRCDYCNEEPIIGTRWHCSSCDNESVDFCSDCVVSQMYSGSAHPTSHKLVPVQNGDARMTYSDSSSESVSGSVFDSSTKNVESSNDMSSSGSDDEQDSLQTDGNTTLNYEQEYEDARFNESRREIKAETSHEHSNLTVIEDYNERVKQEVYIIKEESDLEEVVDEDLSEDYQVSESLLVDNGHFALKTEDCNSLDENVTVARCDDQLSSEEFTDTQNISYSYLHSNLLLDSNT